MQDKIIIRDLQCFGNHGVLKEENQLGQKFLVSLVLYTNTQIAGTTDDLSHAINYATVCEEVTAFMKENTFQLIETVAELMAQQLLLHYPLLYKIQVTIKKPWAPIQLPLETVSVEITRQWHTTYLGIGSNLGDKIKNIKDALAFFEQHPLCKNMRVSNLYQTKPYGEKAQDDFINGAFAVETLLTPAELLDCISSLEQQLKRERLRHWGPRTIDVDILFYDDIILNTKELTIPHIETHKRDFVLIPLCDLNPYLQHPVLQQPICQLLETLFQKDDYENTNLVPIS